MTASQPPARSARRPGAAGARASRATTRRRAARAASACSRAARAAPTSRAAARAPARRAARGSPVYIDDTSERSIEAALAQPLDHLALVAGQLQVHVELDAARRPRRRSGRAPRRASGGSRALGVLVVVGEHEPAVAQRAARRTRSCRRRARAPPRSSRRVLPGATWSAPLWPTRHHSPGTTGTSRSCGCRRPGRARGSACRSGGRAGRRARTPSRRRLAGSACRRPLGRAPHQRAAGRAPRRAPRSSDTSREPPPRVDAGEEAALRLPDVPDARRGCAGRAGRRRCRASDRPRAGGAGSAARRSSSREHVRARARRGAGRSACASRSSARAPGRRTARPRARAVRITSQARRGERRQRSPRR